MQPHQAFKLRDQGLQMREKCRLHHRIAARFGDGIDGHAAKIRLAAVRERCNRIKDRLNRRAQPARRRRGEDRRKCRGQPRHLLVHRRQAKIMF